MAHFVYERVDAQRQSACVVISPLPIKGLQAGADRYFPLPDDLPGDGEPPLVREIGAFDSDETATLFFVKYLAKLSEPSWKILPCYLGADHKLRRYARL